MTDAAPIALPAASRVLAVCAHPDDESFGLGGVLGTYADQGAQVAVVCLTRGEASTLGAAEHDLVTARAGEFADASDELGVGHSLLADHPDGALDRESLSQLTDEVGRAVAQHQPDVVVAFHPAGVTGHPDHQQATRAALRAAASRAVPLLAWYVPPDVATALNREFGSAFVTTPPEPGDLTVAVDRRRQRRAIACHRSQHGSLRLVERRLDLTGPVEHLRAYQPAG